MEQCVYNSTTGHILYILSFDTTCMYIICMKSLNVLVCVNEFILSFLLLFSVFIYQEHTNANIGPR